MAKKLAPKKSSAKASQGSNASPVVFEKSLAELESIVQDLEAGKLPLGESLACYEEGVGHLKACYAQLSTAERRIELLSGIDADGNPITEPLQDEAGGDLEEKSRNRSRRRTSPPAGKTKEAQIAAENQENEVDDGELLF